MKRPAEEEGHRWLAQAESDLNDALYLMDGERYNVACFIAQQAAEKALKAVLYASGREAVWGHSVAELCKEAVTFAKALEPLCRQGAALDRFYIPTRYPNGLPGGIPAEAFLEQDARFATDVADKILEVVRKALSN